jgi:hypothetical protein
LHPTTADATHAASRHRQAVSRNRRKFGMIDPSRSDVG